MKQSANPYVGNFGGNRYLSGTKLLTVMLSFVWNMMKCADITTNISSLRHDIHLYLSECFHLWFYDFALLSKFIKLLYAWGDSLLQDFQVKSIMAMRRLNIGDKKHTNIRALHGICTCECSIHSVKDYAHLKLHWDE